LPNQVIADVDVVMTSNSLGLYAYNVTFSDAGNTGNQNEVEMNWKGCSVDGCQPRYDGVRQQTIYSKPDLVVTDDTDNTYISSGATISVNTAEANKEMTLTVAAPISTFTFGSSGPDFPTSFESADTTPYVFVYGMAQDGVCRVSRVTPPSGKVLVCEVFTTTDGTAHLAETKTSSSIITFTEAHDYLATATGGDKVTLYGANVAFNVGPDNSGSSVDNPKLFYNGPDSIVSMAMGRKDRIELQGTAVAAASGIATVVLAKTMANTAKWESGYITEALAGGHVLDDLASSTTYEITRGTTEATECSGRGLCDSESGICGCFDGYSGPACSSQVALV